MPTLIFTKNGWLTSTSQFSTDKSLAKVYEFPDAISVCTRLYGNGVVAVPVRQVDLGYMNNDQR